MQLISFVMSALMLLFQVVPGVVPAAHDVDDVSAQAQAMITAEQLAEVDQTLEVLGETLENTQFALQMGSFWPTFYTDFVVGVLLAMFYSVHDGMCPLTVVYIQGPLAAEAYTRGMIVFPGDDEDAVMIRDAYRHWLWGFRAARHTGYDNARRHTINYEYGIFLARPAIDYFEQVREQGGSATDALRQAVAYALNRRAIIFAETEFEQWSVHFGNDDIMDLWNNYQGIVTALDAGVFTGRLRDLFMQDWDGGLLIMNETEEEVTRERRQIIFKNPQLWMP